ncbi:MULTISPECIES: hypothetical protein [unclassified Rhizobium]|uniref:hypothetical protein n=1 Tax=unclassified Rhizobium TaxID=2613769 RepID=UPI001A9985EA|nr:MULTISPECIES: hypothetical protein [unclassified Rhizobium]MBX5164529.1 hypothetical protein [Rhizobium sp. NZLR4b]MBX5190845.1 hypothetical protein [Rhizobium sp. NZLR3b]MBX5204460.1 hypothetical protein [Rhizobium sp. NZLR1]QSZ24680.1 hypothetical protein J3O30_30495 [Rhizobium sp. NZLR1]
MTIKTYDPISAQFDTIPVQKPGTQVIEFSNGVATRREAAGPSLVDRLKEMATPRSGIAAIVIAVVLIYLLGVAGLLLTMAVIVGLGVFLSLNRRNPIAVMLSGPVPAYYLVTVSAVPIADERRVQLKDTGIYATVHIEYQAAVIDPIEVVQKGIHDVREYFSPRLYKKISRLASEGKLDDKLESLRKVLMDFAEEPIDDTAIRITECNIEITVEEAEARKLRTIAAAQLDILEKRTVHQTRAVDRDYYARLLASDEELQAEMMSPHADKAALRDIINQRMAREEQDFTRKLAVMEFAVKNGIIEPHQVRRDYPQMMGELARAFGGQISAPAAATPIAGNPGLSAITDQSTTDRD